MRSTQVIFLFTLLVSTILTVQASPLLETRSTFLRPSPYKSSPSPSRQSALERRNDGLLKSFKKKLKKCVACGAKSDARLRPLPPPQSEPPRPPPRRQSLHGLMDMRAGFRDDPPY